MVYFHFSLKNLTKLNFDQFSGSEKRTDRGGVVGKSWAILGGHVVEFHPFFNGTPKKRKQINK